MLQFACSRRAGCWDDIWVSAWHQAWAWVQRQKRSSLWHSGVSLQNESRRTSLPQRAILKKNTLNTVEHPFIVAMWQTSDLKGEGELLEGNDPLPGIYWLEWKKAQPNQVYIKAAEGIQAVPSKLYCVIPSSPITDQRNSVAKCSLVTNRKGKTL